MIFHPTRKEPGMISIARTSRAALVAAAALAIAAPIASAKPIGPVTPIVDTGHVYAGTYRPVNTNVQLPPDRQDKVGTLSQATNIHQVPVATTKTVTKSSFDWTSATIGAGFILSIVLVGAGAIGLRGRRRMALGV
jgi:hypothetical protein